MPLTQHPERRTLGIATIEVQDEDFFDGYQAGHLSYHLDGPAAPFTDSSLYTFLWSRLLSVDASDRYRVGYISGWFAALYGYCQPSQVATTALAVPRQLEVQP
jgi:hypothetical protein